MTPSTLNVNTISETVSNYRFSDNIDQVYCKINENTVYELSQKAWNTLQNDTFQYLTIDETEDWVGLNLTGFATWSATSTDDQFNQSYTLATNDTNEFELFKGMIQFISYECSSIENWVDWDVNSKNQIIWQDWIANFYKINSKTNQWDKTNYLDFINDTSLALNILFFVRILL